MKLTHLVGPKALSHCIALVLDEHVESRAMEQRSTGLLAEPAGRPTNTTMLVHSGVALALCRTDPASLSAGRQLGLHQHRAWFRETRDDAGGGKAYVCAIEAGS